MNNTLIRIIVSFIAIPLILLVSIWGKIIFLIFVLGIVLLSFWEFSELSVKKSAYPNKLLGLLSVSAFILNSYFNFLDFTSLIILVSLLLLLIELFRNKSSAIFNVGSSMLGIYYIGLFGSTIVLIREFFGKSEIFYSEGGYLIISIFVGIWICDSAAFFIGSAFGKRKLFPRVSPKKSWEGAIAGFVFALLAMIAAKEVLLDLITMKDAIFIGMIIGSVGQLGDLIESLIKRDAGVKDSSNLIPGHGGIFDRFDSLFLTAPVVYLYLHFFVII